MENQLDLPKPELDLPLPEKEITAGQTPMAGVTSSIPPAPAPNAPKKSFPKGIIIASVLLLLIAVGAGAYFLSNSANQEYGSENTGIVHELTPQPATPTPDPIAGWKTYSNDDFSVKYNPSWTVEEDTQVTSIFDPKSIDTSAGTGDGITPLPTEYFDILKVETTTQTVKQYVDELLTSPKYLGGNSGRKEVKVGDLSGEIYRELGERSEGYDIAVSNGSKLIIINIPVGDPDQDNTINSMLSTFKFTDSNEAPTPTCRPRPTCLDAKPACKIVETPDMCPRTVTPSP